MHQSRKRTIFCKMSCVCNSKDWNMQLFLKINMAYLFFWYWKDGKILIQCKITQWIEVNSEVAFSGIYLFTRFWWNFILLIHDTTSKSSKSLVTMHKNKNAFLSRFFPIVYDCTLSMCYHNNPLDFLFYVNFELKNYLTDCVKSNR